jgi:NAD(P)-dependent dehydrogenase (short-subunit alcohol dehydrogenase family)
MVSIKNKNIFITGGGSGIGLATAKQFVSQGANVVVLTKTIVPPIDLPSDKSLIIKGDVTSRNQVKKALERGTEKFGSLDILINNAGVAKRENFLDTKEKDWDFVIGVNIKGVFICIQEFIKTLINADKNRINADKSAPHNSHKSTMIINIASGAGIYGVEEIAVYSATKAAVINITQSLDEELKNLGINWVAVCPGSTNTKMFNNLFPGQKPFHTPEQIAEVIYKTATGEIKPDDRLIVDVFHHIK